MPSITLGSAFSTAPGNIQSPGFLQFPISAHFIAQGRAAELYVDQVLAEGIREIAGNTRVELKYFYGAQVAWPFIPLGRFSFLTHAETRTALSLFIYFGCIYLLWKSCGTLNSNWKIVALCALDYPPLFHFFVR